MSTTCTHVDNFTASAADSTHATHKVIKSVRKTHKSLPNGREAVWPEYIEQALVDGLERYRPAGKSGLRPNELQRFPKRNKSISDHIFNKTGVRRTPKQVGSRLQQLKETVKDPYLQKLLTSKEYDDSELDRSDSCLSQKKGSPRPMKRSPSAASSDVLIQRDCRTPVSEISSCSSSVTSIPLTPPRRVLPFTPQLSVQLDIAPPPTSLLSQIREQNPEECIVLDLDEQHLQISSKHSSFTSPYRWASVRAEFAPQITFNWSAFFSSSSYRCISTVYLNGEAIYSDGDQMVLLQPYTKQHTTNQYGSQFRTYLVPDFWTAITQNVTGESQYMIVQTITEVSKDSQNTLTSAICDSPVICTVTYAVNNAHPWTHASACHSPNFSTPLYPSIISSPGYSTTVEDGYLPALVVPASTPLPTSPPFHQDFEYSSLCQIPSPSPYVSEGTMHFSLAY